MKKRVKTFVPPKTLIESKDDQYYDLDSSPSAWLYYERVYSEVDNKLNINYDITNKYQLRVVSRSRIVHDLPLKNGFVNRIMAWNLNANRVNNKIEGSMLRLGGDCDFNFNQIKCKLLKTKVNQDKTINDETKKRINARLDQFQKQHHCVLNFSLMQVVGGMNTCKQSLGKGNLDRLDSFVYYLNEYYCVGDTSIFRRCTKQNKVALKSYLKGFDNIYDYCHHVYFLYGAITVGKRDIESKEFINDLIIHGSKLINTAASIERYMDLAENFWEFKKKHFIKIEDASK